MTQLSGHCAGGGFVAVHNASARNTTTLVIACCAMPKLRSRQLQERRRADRRLGRLVDGRLAQRRRLHFKDRFSGESGAGILSDCRGKRTAAARCTVERLMRLQGLRRVRRGTISEANAPCPPDSVNRQFRAERPNQLWVSDFTYSRLGKAGMGFFIDVVRASHRGLASQHYWSERSGRALGFDGLGAEPLAEAARNLAMESTRLRTS